jgi:hypothetical protein
MPFWTIVATLPLSALGGCGAGKFGSPEQFKPDIGAAPPYAQPVRVTPAREGESPVVVGDRFRVGLAKANTIIGCLAQDRAATRATFLGTAIAGAPENCAKIADQSKARRWKGAR